MRHLCAAWALLWCSLVDASHPSEAVLSEELGKCVRSHWLGLETDPIACFREQNPTTVRVSARGDGRRLAESWGEGPNPEDAIEAAFRALREQLAEQTDQSADSLLFSFVYDMHSVGIEQIYDSPNSDRGIVGLEVKHHTTVLRHAPVESIVTNRSLARVLERFLERLDLTEGELSSTTTIRTFSAAEFLVLLAPALKVVPLHRGDVLVDIAEVTPAAIRDFARRAADWLAHNVDADGRLTYSYHPSRARESGANNVLRQWMGTGALRRAAIFFDDLRLSDLADRNLLYNLAFSYRTHGQNGLIAYEDKVKLGAMTMALHALSLQAEPSRWSSEITALNRTVDGLWSEDGSFRTFFAPFDRNDNQNFYPGETLMVWANRYSKDPDPVLLDKMMKSFRYYREWHFSSDRNPAFVPWHTQFAYQLWRATGDDELGDFIFEMNDWLLDIQQLDLPAQSADMLGRFYAPGKPFGPPHASSTGVYLEGLIDALALARSVGDREREERYRHAIRYGFRSLFQLQYTDDVDMFYVAANDRTRVRGGLRTTVYDNRVRVDNVQHALIAAIKYLEFLDAAP